MSCSPLNVRCFGARGDGVADDTAAIQAAINAAKAMGLSTRSGATVYFPPGEYSVSSPLLLPRTGATARGVVWLDGENRWSSRIQGAASFPTNRAMIEWSDDEPYSGATYNAYYQRVANLTIELPDVAGTKGLWHKPVNAIATYTSLVEQQLQLDIENVLFEANNEFHEVIIDLEIGCKGATWRNVFGDPARGTGANKEQYSTLLIRTGYQWPAKTITDLSRNVSTVTATFSAAHGMTAPEWVVIAGSTNYNGAWRITGVPTSTTLTFTIATTPANENGAGITGRRQAPPGEDSWGFNISRLLHVNPMFIRGGWCRAFEGRLYATRWDTCFSNGLRSAHPGSDYHFLNSGPCTLDSLTTEGNGGRPQLRLTRCEDVTLDGAHIPIGDPTDAAWAPSVPNALNARVAPTKLVNATTPTTKRYFLCTTAGTSSATEPTWGTPNLNDTVADNTVVWTAKEEAVGNSIELVACRGVEIRSRFAIAGAPVCSARLVKAISIDADCKDVVADGFDINAVFGSYANEIEILAPAAAGNMISGTQIQTFNDLRGPYRVGNRSNDNFGTGTIANGQSTVTVTHGLGLTPAAAMATPQGNEAVWVTAKGATTFTVNRAGTTGALNFDWVARV